MCIAIMGRWCTVLSIFLMVMFAQEVPDAARRVFSHGVIPVPMPEETATPSLPEPVYSSPILPPAAASVPPEPQAPSTIQPPSPEKADSTQEIAATAWRYFETNYKPATGWFDSVHGYPYTTMWDLSSGIAAVACAEQLGIIPPKRADDLLRSALKTLVKLRLYNSELPNREYTTASAAISGPKATAGKGTGWSALDVGRLLIWLKIVAAWHPEYTDLTREIVQRWKFDRLAYHGEMFGVYFGGSSEYHRQEGRLGYEQYSATGYELWGVGMKRAKDYVETQPVQVLGVDLAADKRNLPFLTSEPFLLAALEVGTIDPRYTTLTENLYEAQKRRWQSTHELTAVSEDSLDRAPWFTYYNVSYQGKAWQCRSHSGEPSANNCGVSTKAAFGWAALFDDDYSQLLEKTARTLASADGYLAGRYPDGKTNTSLNINTNAVILEAMLYRRRGRRAFLENTP
jgi:hypothetical protein